MSSRKALVAQADPGPAAPDVVQQLLAERRELKVANERLRLEIEEARAARGKPDRRLAILEEENRRELSPIQRAPCTRVPCSTSCSNRVHPGG